MIQIFLDILHRIFRAILGVMILAIIMFFGLYVITAAPLCWIIFGNKGVRLMDNKLHEYVDEYNDYVFFGSRKSNQN